MNLTTDGLSGSGRVVVIGEVLVELSTREPFSGGAGMRLGFSGDALNAAAAAAAAGAHVVLVARVPDDELGAALVAYASGLGIDTSAVRRMPGQHGAYLIRADPTGERQFVYLRRGSVGSTLEPADLDEALLHDTLVLTSGITCAVSPTAAATVRRAAEIAGGFVYDPNFRPRLTSVAKAARALRDLAPRARLVTPSWPGEARALLDLPADAGREAAAARVERLGATAIALTCGPDGVLLREGSRETFVESPPAPRVVDQTGAGDSFVGTVAARLALGDDLVDAVRLGAAAASLSVQGVGGTGFVPSLEQARLHLARSFGTPTQAGPQ
jgi:2-dehydro-3-deoxygluconokinase